MKKITLTSALEVFDADYEQNRTLKVGTILTINKVGSQRAFFNCVDETEVYSVIHSALLIATIQEDI